MTNPLRVGLVEERLPPPCTVVIFGASGDLTKRKLVPALYTLGTEQLLPPNFAIVGFARRPIGDGPFRAQMKEGVAQFARHRPIDETLWSSFEKGIYYHQGNFDDPASYVALRARLEEIEREQGIPGNRIYYLSTPPGNFVEILENLGKAGLIAPAKGPQITRLIIEKPFGTDLETAQILNREVLKVADESQVYRIDHYLGKETVQNLLAFRFANGIFEPLWNNRYVDHVQITGAEAIGIEGRGGYFEQAGILRDMVQNHLFQILCLTAMEPPAAFNADDLRDEKLKVLKALRKYGRNELDKYVVRGQYRAGSVGGKPLIGYHEEQGVQAGSTTETYVALRLFLDNWRWAGVPFYLRSAKAMPKKTTEVALVFKGAPHRLLDSGTSLGDQPNVLSIRIQPDEGIALRFGAKLPGPAMNVRPVTMEFRYGTSFGTEPPEAYERLLLDCMVGDPALFTRGDEVEASWRFITPIHQAWAALGKKELPSYEAGTWGPTESDELLKRDGRSWRQP